MKRYVYVGWSDPTGLQEQVNNLAAEGWEPIGPVSPIPWSYLKDAGHVSKMDGTLLLQLMVKE
jgi:hypothetical protein